MYDLTTLGWDDDRAREFQPHAALGLEPGRVAIQHRGAYDILTAEGDVRCDVRGKLFEAAESPADLPAVGDWVAFARRDDGAAGTIDAVLARRTRFSRKQAWQAAEEQVLAANVDVIFIVTSLNEDLNLRRLERYLILARESGALPVVLLTKADLHSNPDAGREQVDAIAGGIPVVTVSSRSGAGLDLVRSYLPPGATAVLIGSSGVGKSTLVNTLAGADLLETQEIREDGKGRHTTTRRELIQLPGGALLIDTPGIRELQLWVADDGLGEAFEDVTSLFGKCRFSDCTHQAEPGCAIKQALEEGSLSHERWTSYQKLDAELAYLERRLDKRALAEKRRKWKSLSQEGRARARQKRARDT